jgi:N-acetylmuramoyl-L-alanine amidase
MEINEDHWLTPAEYEDTTKYGGEITPVFLVMHYTAGWTTAGDVHTLAKGEGQVSSQLVLSREGTPWQLIPFNRKAWHAGPSTAYGYNNLNSHSIGIEISNAGWIKRTDDGFIDQYGNRIDHTGMFANGKRRTHSHPDEWLSAPHKRLARGDYIWEPFYQPQLAWLDEFVPVALKRYPTIKYIVSHEEIDTRGWKTDPGPAFPMARYTKLLK